MSQTQQKMADVVLPTRNLESLIWINARMSELSMSDPSSPDYMKSILKMLDTMTPGGVHVG
jgi:hypothetical protein